MRLMSFFLKYFGMLYCCLLLNLNYAWADKQAPSENYNILIITVDCLRPDHMGIYGYQRNTTPNIDQFFKGAARFNWAISQSSWTTPSIVSMITSLNPSVHGMDARYKTFDKFYYTPLRQLKEEGYLTLSYTIKDNYANMGWDEEIKKDTLIETLNKYRNKKFFAWYHFREPHLPYNPPEEFKKIFFKGPYINFGKNKEKTVTSDAYIFSGTLELNEKDAVPIRDLYDGEILYVDNILDKLFDFLKRSGLIEKTIIVLTADHGEELMEHGFIGHASTSLAATVFDELIRIPLLIKIPGVMLDQTIETIAQPIDIMPTLFDLMHIKPKYITQGVSHFPFKLKKNKSYRSRAFIETTYCGWQCPEKRLKERIYAVRSKKWKLIEERKDTEIKYSLYNLVKDSGEKRNLYEEEKDVAEEYKKLIALWQENNLHIAITLAEKAAEQHFLVAEEQINQKAFSAAIDNLNDVLNLNKVFSIENPSFIDDPTLGEDWEKIMVRTYELLGRAYSNWAKDKK